MKKILVFFTVLITVISCSKNSDNSVTLENKSTLQISDASKKAIPMPRDASISSKYLIYKSLTNHEKDSISKIILQSSSFYNNPASITSFGESPEYSDYSGYIHLKVFYGTTDYKSNLSQIQVSVNSSYAMVGGGALVTGYTGNGAFLTESAPLNSTTWIAKSKAHIITDPHYLTVYAIGMRIDNVDATFLRSKIHITTNTSSASDTPSTSVNAQANCILTGGGAFDNYAGYGNMLTSSIPNGNTWSVAGKAYRRSDPSQITAYAIGIENISYPTVGYLQMTVNQTSVAAYVGEQYCYAPVNDGYALTCPGGYTTYNTYGRMLVGLYPQDLFPGAQVISKDTPGFGDFGSMAAYAVGIEKRPY